MPDDFPDLYDIEQQGPREWAVTYEPDDTPACFVTARPGEPAEDAKQRAGIIADIMNATVDMCSHDIRDLLDTHIEHYGKAYHADPRS